MRRGITRVTIADLLLLAAVGGLSSGCGSNQVTDEDLKQAQLRRQIAEEDARTAAANAEVRRAYIQTVGETVKVVSDAAGSAQDAEERQRRMSQKAGAPVTPVPPVVEPAAPVEPVQPTPDKHACKGMNSCRGQGGCKSGNQGCKRKNSCKGLGGCRS